MGGQRSHHIIQLSGLFADLGHTAQIRRKDLRVLQRLGEASGLLHPPEGLFQYLSAFSFRRILQHERQSLQGRDAGTQDQRQLSAEGSQLRII